MATLLILDLFCPGLPAQQADIRVGDVIVEVEGTDVTRASGDLVVSIIQ